MVPTSLFWNCVDSTLPAGSLAEAHKIDCEKKHQGIVVMAMLITNVLMAITATDNEEPV